jgi:5-methylcytosine-specific restriction endonuclease McrA
MRGISGQDQRNVVGSVDCNLDKPTASKLKAMIEKQDYKCALSGVDLTPETASVDHITPISQGGLHVMGNIQILHTQVNSAKHSMTQNEFIQMCKRVVSMCK